MRHAEDDVLDSARAATLEDFLEQRDQAVAAFEREPLLRRITRCEVALETFGHRQVTQDLLA